MEGRHPRVCLVAPDGGGNGSSPLLWVAGARLTLTLSRVETKASGANMATELQVEVNDAFSNRQGFGGFPESGAQFFNRLRSSKGGDERIRGVGKLMERANLQDLEMLNRGGKS